METMSWTPLESNPDVMNNIIESLGVTPDWKFVDIYGFDEELLQFIPRPVLAVVLLFPCETESSDSQPECDRKESKETGDVPQGEKTVEVYYMSQLITNACGTIALIHSVANCMNTITFTENSTLKKFIEETKSLDPMAKGEALMSTQSISDTIKDIVLTGQTEAPAPTAISDCHFIALTQVGGKLYELDGRKPGPIVHGPSSPETFLVDATKICQAYLEKSPQSFKFSAVALCKELS